MATQSSAKKSKTGRSAKKPAFGRYKTGHTREKNKVRRVLKSSGAKQAEKYANENGVISYLRSLPAYLKRGNKMRVIRNGLFETNSSSSHSVHILKGEYAPLTLPVTEDGFCFVYPGEFGWEIVDYRDAPTKASYCLTYAKGWAEEEDRLLSMLESVIKETTMCKKVVWVPERDTHSPWGYIDHQSDHGEGNACGEAFESLDNLRDFIFNPY